MLWGTEAYQGKRFESLDGCEDGTEEREEKEEDG